MNKKTIIKLADTPLELEQILALQNINHVHNLSDSDKEANGFVTLKHNLELLVKMNNAAKQVIAIAEHELVGYALVMLAEFRESIPLLGPMFDVFATIDYKGKKLPDYSYYVMGQICIAQAYRGQGIFEAMYAKQKERYASDFEICLTEVSARNMASLKAHAKVGFQEIHRFQDSIDEWVIMIWEFNAQV